MNDATEDYVELLLATLVVASNWEVAYQASSKDDLIELMTLIMNEVI